ncbi:MAG: hypothetical protein GX883_05355 [Firmicutes bacterium]|nr:hypothetical protein [Bacillota bacterium]
MRHFRLVLLSILLIAALLLALVQWNLLPSLFYSGGGPGKTVPIPPEGARPDAASGPDDFTESSGSLKSLAREITAAAPDDYGKLCAIYDWVTANIAYDVEKAKKMEDYGYGAEYLLKYRQGVCHDYAELTRALLKAVGIKATYERGEVHPAPGKTEHHAWNRVRIGESWYGLDTTWGSGFVDQEKGRFIQRPSRLYLTTVEELARLHSDPAYKESREIEWRRAQSAAAKAVYLPEYESGLLELFNKTRNKRGLASLQQEPGLSGAVRRSAVAGAAKACLDEEFTLDQLNGEIEQNASQLRLAKAGLYAFTLWDYPFPAVEEIYGLIAEQQDLFLEKGDYEGLAVGVVRKGDLLVVVLAGLSYH